MTGTRPAFPSSKRTDHAVSAVPTSVQPPAEGAGRPRARRHTGWIPFLLIMASILAVTGGAVTWVLSPNWHRSHDAAVRNVGEIPTSGGPVLASMLISPVRIEIPRLHAVAPIVQVATLPNNELDVPLNPKIVGWWDRGAKPGAKRGTAILDGHINYAGVKGVLADIGTLDPGDLVYVYGMHGRTHTKVRFKITGVRTYSKTTLPYKEIFDQKSVGRLAIVTCGGPFDASTGNYRDNIVAFAVPA